MASAPIFDNFDDPIRHGEGDDHMGFIKDTPVDVKYLVCALAIANGTKEYARKVQRGIVLVMVGSLWAST